MLTLPKDLSQKFNDLLAGKSFPDESKATHAGRGLKPRPERFNAPAIFELYEKPCGRGNIPIRIKLSHRCCQF